MTTPTSTPSTPENIDTGPLSWVIGEIRESLGKSKTALADTLNQDADSRSTGLQHAKSFLHQAHGALQIVDIDGLAIITETVEEILERIDSAQVDLNQHAIDVIGNAYQALLEYLEELLSGASHQPVRLFPYYRALLEVRGAERIHPADLFFPNLGIRPQLPIPAGQLPAADYVSLRKRFERSLLPVLKGGDEALERKHAAAMRDIIAEVERAQSNQQLRAFWWVLHGFAEAVAAGQIGNELYVKQLFARINLQIRRLGEGSASIAERLLRDALFFIARVVQPSSRVEQIRLAYQLAGAVPQDYERKRYGQIDVNALNVAKDKLGQAKTAWNRIASGDISAAASFEQEMAALADVMGRLNAPALLKLVRELSGIARLAANARPGDALGLEMATSLLFVENALTRISSLPDNFNERADAMTARLLSIVSGEMPRESAQWLDDMSREAQQRQTMTVLANELHTSLSQVEKMLEEYFGDPSQTGQLGQIETTLHQISGALAILDQEDAQRAIEHTQQAVKRFAEAGPDNPPDPAQFHHVAKNVGALSFFIETLQNNADTARKRFSFDPAAGVFHANLLTRTDDATLDVVIDEPVESGAHSSEFVPSVVQTVQDLPTVEDELALHQKQSAELALSLKAQPDNPELQAQLKETLQQVRMEASLVDNPEAGERAKAAMDALSRIEQEPAEQVLDSLITTTAAEPASVPAPAPVVAPETDAEVDAELLEIFLMEAEEVLGCVTDTIPESRSEPYNQDHLTTLRRSFHTLKGSGRMVGLTAFGEAAWSIEQVLNLRLSETRAGDDDLYALLDKAVEVLGAWVKDLQETGRSPRTPHALVAAAERIKQNLSFQYDEAAVVTSTPAETHAEAHADTHAETPALAPAPVIAHDVVEALEPVAPLVDPLESAVIPALDIDLGMDLGHSEVAQAPLAHESAQVVPELPALKDVALDASHGEQVEATPMLDLPPMIEALQVPDVHDTSADAEILPLLSAVEEEPSADDLAALGQLIGTAELEPHQPAEVHELSTEGEHHAHSEVADITQTTAEVLAFPTPVADTQESDDGVKHIGDIEISVPLHNIYLAETDELVRLLSQDFAEWRHEPERNVNVQVVHAAHSLAGSSATVGFKPLQEVAHGLESILQFLSRKPARLTHAEFDALEHGVERIRYMLQMFALGEMPAREPEQVEILERMQQEIEARLRAPEATHPPSFESPVESSNEMTAIATPETHAAQPAEDIPALLDEPPVQALEVAPILEMMPELAPLASDLEMSGAAHEESHEASSAEPLAAPTAEASHPESESLIHELPIAHDTLEAHVEAPAAVAPEPAHAPALDDVQHEPHDISDTGDAHESLEALDDGASLAAELNSAADASEITALAEPVQSAQVATPAALDLASEPVVVPATAPVVEQPRAQVSVAPAATDDKTEQADLSALDPALLNMLRDELDPDLLPVFLEEGRDMLPQIEHDLRAWEKAPSDPKWPQSLLRLLHTVKGSARMAGAMTLGQHMHELETRIEQVMRAGAPSSGVLEELIGRYDFGHQMFELLQNPEGIHELIAKATAAQQATAEPVTQAAVAETVNEPVVMQAVMPVRTGPLAAPVLPKTQVTQTQAPAAPLVRVRADLLDRLVNQAGEVSISRSKLETEVGSLRGSLSELTENVSRLRNQLREIEMQAESQIASRMAHSGERDFDPLEFDRFTRLQELTRMMAESVNDVSSVQTNIARMVDNATNDLTTQGRLTRDLQQDLMRVRMVQFASISERLYRVTRQASKELDKRVNLDIRGGAVEMDRNVLERMTGPFEHLLRNAIVHGIEARDERNRAGKADIGELLVEIRQEGNEVVIQFSDDGRGLNIDRIREKALSQGLLTADEEVSQSEVTDLIFHPGFSTADSVTELAGRGVGMDVVRSEAAALGGRVEVASEWGKGAHFTIHLPLTLAVTQVVLLSSGGRVFAVPSVLVEQVQQLKTHALTAAYNDGAVVWQGQRVALHYLPTLLGDLHSTPTTQQYSPVIILKSGNERVAIHVDEIVGNREVVVKNIGPQLARLIGIAGATVLGSGEIVLILNPVPLATRLAHEPHRMQRAGTSEMAPATGAVAELVSSAPAQVSAEPVQGLRHQHIVMVVDDSLTVRRVTQRLLTREGYQVVLAKDGVDALEHLQSITPDVMLVDIEMPRMDGFDLTRNVRGDERTRHIPIIMITSRTASKHRNYAMELGVNEYLGKPYQEETLLSLISGFVGATQAVQ